MNWLKRITNRPLTKREKQVKKVIKQLTGKYPSNVKIYVLALRHSSVSRDLGGGFKESNERLEFLGDAVLNLVTAEFLFKKYPYKGEGFLTEIRSKLVNRESLNQLAVKLGLNEFVAVSGRKNSQRAYRSIYGNAVEAFLGALYLDKGFAFSKKFIVHKVIQQYYNMETLIETRSNYKSQLLEWSQKKGVKVNFALLQDSKESKDGQFTISVLIDEDVIAEGKGFSKKKAEQNGARKACEELGIAL